MSLETVTMNTVVPCTHCNTRNRVPSPTICNVIRCYSCHEKFIYRPPKAEPAQKKIVAVFRRFRGQGTTKESTNW